MNTETIKDKMKHFSPILMQMMTGFWMTQCIYSVAKLGVADQLKRGPRSISDLAKSLNAHEDYLYRVMRALASIGIFLETKERVFELTPTAELLISDGPESMHPVVIMLGEENYKAWEYLYPALKSGCSPFEMAYGMDAYEYYEKNPKAGEIFNAAMAALVRNDYESILQAYAFSEFANIVDVGGGHGMLLKAILEHYPKLSGILFELPQVVDEAIPIVENTSIKGRCRIEPGNFFESVIPGGDAYILSRVLHGFSDEMSLQILRNVHCAMPTHGKLLLMEFVLQTGNDPSTAQSKFMDVNMLVFSPGGRDRTQEEYEDLLKQAGFRLTNITPTTSGIAVIEALKA